MLEKKGFSINFMCRFILKLSSDNCKGFHNMDHAANHVF